MYRFLLVFVSLVFSTFIYARGGRSQQVSPNSIAANRAVIVPEVNEACHKPHIYQGPQYLFEKEGRLKLLLRQAAKKADVRFNIVMSAVNFVNNNEVLGNAFADLSVTGRKSYNHFKNLFAENKLNEDYFLGELQKEQLVARYSPMVLRRAITKALNRAFKVANVIAYGSEHPLRESLGWIAVSGEDDQPYRPVNASASKFIQRDLEVEVKGLNVQTRYIIAESKHQELIPPYNGERTLPQVTEPSLGQDAKVLLFIHGMDSRAEEAVDMANALKEVSKRTGENWTIISMDLPTSGYATKLNHFDVSPLEVLGTPRSFPPGFNARGRHKVPVLDFMESFVVKFVNTLDEKINLKSKIRAVVGGSLGGNLTFRLGRRIDLPWLTNLVSWSPASIWDGLADGADMFKQLGVATAWKRAGGDAENLIEKDSSREDFFKDAFGGAINIGPINIVPAQPDQWWSNNWECFEHARTSAQLERHETYNKNFRLWHWRLGGEQLIFSHQQPPNMDHPRYLDNKIRMFLACGSEDDFNFTNICSSSQRTAERMITTPGQFRVFEQTGHSIHNERPALFVDEIVKFLNK